MFPKSQASLETTHSQSNKSYTRWQKTPFITPDSKARDLSRKLTECVQRRVLGRSYFILYFGRVSTLRAPIFRLGVQKHWCVNVSAKQEILEIPQFFLAGLYGCFMENSVLLTSFKFLYTKKNKVLERKLIKIFLLTRTYYTK